MKNKKDNSKIKTLDDLRLAKRKLKIDMKISENKHDNSFINKTLDFVINLKSDSNFATSKVENTLSWLGNKASNKYPMKGMSKILISGLIMIAVPIITNKIQEYIEEKFK